MLNLMKNFFKGFCIITMLLAGSCRKFEKFPLWVGNKEMLVYKYSNSSASTPPAAELIEQSKFISVDAASATNIGQNTIRISLEGVRVQSSRNNFEVKKVKISEREEGSRKWQQQSEFSLNTSASKTDIASVLVLDMSTSLGGVVDDLKKYAKTFAHTVVEGTTNSKVAVIFFSTRSAIQSTAFYDASNIGQLDALIDGYTNYQDRTALFEATKAGLDLLGALSFQGSKSLVVFTDGGDNDSNNPDDLKATINNSEIARYTIGLKGADFDKKDLESIGSDKGNNVIAKKESDLEDVFSQITKQVVSIYHIEYDRSDQILNQSIEILFEVELDKIK